MDGADTGEVEVVPEGEDEVGAELGAQPLQRPRHRRLGIGVVGPDRDPAPVPCILAHWTQSSFGSEPSLPTENQRSELEGSLQTLPPVQESPAGTLTWRLPTVVYTRMIITMGAEGVGAERKPDGSWFHGGLPTQCPKEKAIRCERAVWAHSHGHPRTHPVTTPTSKPRSSAVYSDGNLKYWRSIG